MSLTTYAGLKEAIASTLNRTDMGGYVPDWIALCEAELNSRLFTRKMVESMAFTVSAESVALPADFNGVTSFQMLINNGYKLEYRSPAAFDDQPLNQRMPTYYTVIGDYFWFSPPPDSSYQARLRYRKKVPALTDADPTNWVLADHPNLYLYGSLLHSAPFLKDDGRLLMWQGKFDQLLAQINAQEVSQNLGATLQTQSGMTG